jgi:hypothetical protein
VPRLKDLVAKFGEGAIKGTIKEKAAPFIEVFKEGQIGERELRLIIITNHSVYRDFMPKEFKEAILKLFEGNESYLNNVDDGLLTIFMKAMTEEIGLWFPKVVSPDRKGWLLRELQYIKEDLDKRRTEAQQ